MYFCIKDELIIRDFKDWKDFPHQLPCILYKKILLILKIPDKRNRINEGLRSNRF